MPVYNVEYTIFILYCTDMVEHSNIIKYLGNVPVIYCIAIVFLSIGCGRMKKSHKISQNHTKSHKMRFVRKK